jgi:hypothetical protein
MDSMIIRLAVSFLNFVLSTADKFPDNLTGLSIRRNISNIRQGLEWHSYIAGNQRSNELAGLLSD